MIGQFSSNLFFIITLPLILFADAVTTVPDELIYSIVSVEGKGSQITLSDGFTYDVSYADHAIAKQWGDEKTRPAEVIYRNTENPNFDYPIELTNKATRQKIQVRHEKIVIDSTLEAPSEEDDSD